MGLAVGHGGDVLRGLVWATVSSIKHHDLDGRGIAWSFAVAAVVLLAGLVLFAFWPEFPRQGFDRITSGKGLAANLRTAFLPALTLALTEVAVFSRLLRSDMMTTLQEDYVLSARAKGMPTHRVLVRDALRPSSFSLITLAGVSLGRLLGGTVIVETIFNLPGMGRLIVQDGVIPKDFTVVQGSVLVIATHVRVGERGGRPVLLRSRPEDPPWPSLKISSSSPAPSSRRRSSAPTGCTCRWPRSCSCSASSSSGSVPTG